MGKKTTKELVERGRGGYRFGVTALPAYSTAAEKQNVDGRHVLLERSQVATISDMGGEEWETSSESVQTVMFVAVYRRMCCAGEPLRSLEDTYDECRL